MSVVSALSVSLAAKCRLLFGFAVVLIVASALYIPWLRMRDLVNEANIATARRAARLALARSDLRTRNWAPQQEALSQWWPTRAPLYGFHTPVPKLIALADPANPEPPRDAGPFVQRAIKILLRDPTLAEAPPSVTSLGRELLYRVVLPVRSSSVDPPPGTLLGVVSIEYPTARAKQSLWINLALSLMAGALAGILAVLVFYLITQKLILSPVRELTRVAVGVSRGEHSIRSRIATGDEFEELARAFNAMLTHLEASENELRTINKSLDTRLGELAEHNVALFESNKLKGQFIANVSHELRTPLTSIIGFAELLREAALSKDERMLRYSENIMSSGRMLLGLINDLLDIAKIEAGKLELHVSRVDLRELAANLVDFMRPLANKKRLSLRTELADDLPTIKTDSGRLQQVLYNLLSNAVKFTSDGDRVVLSMAPSDDSHVAITVRDSGIGIDEDELPHVFEKFHQLDASVTREHGGSGLGLAISKELVAILGGAIRVSSEIGKGSEFTVVLPLESPTGASRPGVDLT